MNRALPEIILPGGMDITVLERQRARMKWQQDQLQQPQPSFFNGNHELSGFSLTTQAQEFSGLISNELGIGDLVSRVVKPDPGFENGWADIGGVDGYLGYGACGYGNAGFEMSSVISRTISCPPAVAAVADEKLISGVGRESFKKRKADKTQNLKVVSEEDTKEKRIKGSAEDGDSKITEKNSSTKKNITTNNNNNNRETSTDTSKDTSKVSDVRREKISERMKYLQDLVPGCNKITGKAGMLDEIINYVQSLQRQVEFLSMKLAAVNPRLDFNIDNFFTKEIFPASTSNFPAVGVSSEMVNPAFFELNQLQQVVSCGLEMGINPSDMALRRTISAPVPIPETFLDSSCFNQIQPPSTWDAELQNLYGMEFPQARSSFLSQPFTASMEGDNLKKVV
ncbi:hypothetical protein LguiA_027525 [Lonicera macranthoides]